MPVNIAVVGAGPAGLTFACALAQAGGYQIQLFDRDQDHGEVATYNPNRSYTIDITGHGFNAARAIGITERFDADLIAFKGIKIAPAPWMRRLGWGFIDEPYGSQGWTGSRGDICRSLQAHLLHHYANSVDLHFGVEAQLANAERGELQLTWRATGSSEVRQFDLVVACDGGGSGLRRALSDQDPGFSVQSMDLGNHAMMLHLDQHLDELDANYLYVLATHPVLAVAGAINGPLGPGDPRWFCQIGFAAPRQFASFREAADLFDQTQPLLRHFASDAMVEAFCQRDCLPTGKAKRCSALVVGRVALLGDAAAPVPPVGQGVNAAMEGATLLAQGVASHRDSLAEGLAAFSRQWHAESDALRQIAMAQYQSKKLSRLQVILAAKFGRLGVQLAKDGNLSYQEAWQQSGQGKGAGP